MTFTKSMILFVLIPISVYLIAYGAYDIKIAGDHAQSICNDMWIPQHECRIHDYPGAWSIANEGILIGSLGTVLSGVCIIVANMENKEGDSDENGS